MSQFAKSEVKHSLCGSPVQMLPDVERHLKISGLTYVLKVIFRVRQGFQHHAIPLALLKARPRSRSADGEDLNDRRLNRGGMTCRGRDKEAKPKLPLQHTPTDEAGSSMLRQQPNVVHSCR